MSVALEAAVFVRCTKIGVGCAAVAVVAAWRVRIARLPSAVPGWWLSRSRCSARVALFGDLVYGGPLKSGHTPGEVTFSLGVLLPHLRLMPAYLFEAMLVPGLVALAWIAVWWVRLRQAVGELAAVAPRASCAPARAVASRDSPSLAAKPHGQRAASMIMAHKTAP